MRYPVQVNRSQFDAMPVIVLPIYVDVGTEVHVFTDAELRARDERIIRAALDFCGWHDARIVRSARNYHCDAIIAAAEADQ